MNNKKTLLYFAIFFVLYEINTYLSNDMIMPAMVNVVNGFHAPLSMVAVSLSLYIIGGSLLQLFLGPITDVMGKRYVMLFGNILFLVASFVITFSSTIEQFLVARLFQGMGMCFIFIGYALIHELFNDVMAVKLTTILANIAITAPLIGPIIGSMIASNFTWHYIFVISGVLGMITLIGLYKYMPQGTIIHRKINLAVIFRSYKNIFMNRNFIFGVTINTISMIPIIAWIGLSPVIVFNYLHQSFIMYILYQAAMFVGLITSSLLIQFIAGRISFNKLFKIGSNFFICGVLFSIVLHQYSYLFMLGMFLYSFGFGLYNGSMMRIALMSTGESQGLTASVSSLISGIGMAGGLEIYNIILSHLNFSLFSYNLISTIILIIAYFATIRFANNNKDRVWR